MRGESVEGDERGNKRNDVHKIIERTRSWKGSYQRGVPESSPIRETDFENDFSGANVSVWTSGVLGKMRPNENSDRE